MEKKKEFYPLLTDLVLDIYDIFRDEQVKNENDSSKFIKDCLEDYFKISKICELDF